MKFEGDQDFTQEPTVLWNKVRNAGFLAACIPDGVVEGQPTMDQAQCTVHPGFSFVRGSLSVNLKVIEAVEPTLLRISLVSKGIGSGSDAEATLNFAPHETGTSVHWQAELKSMSGLMKMLPTELIKGAARKVLEDILTSVKQKLAAN